MADRTIQDKTRDLLNALPKDTQAQVKEILAESQQHFQMLTDTAPDAIVSLSETGLITYWNPASENLFGYSSTEILGQSVATLVPDRYKESFMAKVASWSIGKSAYTGPFELFGINKVGNELIGQCAFSRWATPEGIHFTAFIRDVTELRKWQRIVDHIFQGTVADTGTDFFGSLVANLSVALNIEFAMVTRLIDYNDNLIESVSSICNAKSRETFQYSTEETPCASVMDRQFIHIERDLSDRYPQFSAAIQMPAAQGYLATPLISSQETILGHLVIVDSKAIDGDLTPIKAILKIFAARAGAEMERLALDKQNQTLLRNNQILTRQSLLTQEEERRFLRQEIHDEMGQSLTAIQAYTEIISGADNDPESPIRKSAVAIHKIVHQIFSTVRLIMDRLRPALLDDLGLEASLSQMIEDWQAQHPGRFCSLDISGSLDHVSEQISITLYRIAQESLTNVSRHSDASQVTISIERIEAKPGCIQMDVRDNGAAKEPINNHKHSIGIVGMTERAKALGGTLKVTNHPSRGFHVQVELPLLTSIANPNSELH